MLLHDSSFRLISVLLGVSVMVCRSQAENIELSGAVNPVPVQVRLQDEAVISSEQIHRVYVSASTNEFALVLPKNYRANAQDSLKLVFENADTTTFITARLLSVSSSELKSEVWRERLLREHSDATVRDEFSRATGEAIGVGFELEEPTFAHTVERLLVVYVTTPGGVVEFALHSKPEGFSKDKESFEALLRSFQTNRAGKILPIQTPAEPPTA